MGDSGLPNNDLSNFQMNSIAFDQTRTNLTEDQNSALDLSIIHLKHIRSLLNTSLSYAIKFSRSLIYEHYCDEYSSRVNGIELVIQLLKDELFNVSRMILELEAIRCNTQNNGVQNLDGLFKCPSHNWFPAPDELIGLLELGKVCQLYAQDRFETFVKMCEKFSTTIFIDRMSLIASIYLAILVLVLH